MAKEVDARPEVKKPGIWKASMQAIWHCRSGIVIVLLISFLQGYLQIAGEYSGKVYWGFFSGFLIWGFLALIILNWERHRTGRFTSLLKINKSSLKSFIIRCVFLDILMISSGVISPFLMTGRFQLSVQEMLQPEYAPALAIVGVVTVLAMWIVAVFFSTLLPAALYEDGSGIRRAVARGRKTVWYVTGRILLGPMLWMFACSIIQNTLQNISGGSVLSPEGTFDLNIITTVVFIVSCVQYVVGGAMFFVIVSRAYVIGEERCRNKDMTDDEQIREMQGAE
jgi:hypothetical protein